MRRPDSQYGGVSRSQYFGSIAVIFSILRKARSTASAFGRPCGRLRRLALECAQLGAFPRTLDHDIRGPPAVTGAFMRESLDGGAGSVQGVAQLSLACVARGIWRGRIAGKGGGCRGGNERDESHNYR